MPSLPAAVLPDPAALAEALDEHGACLLRGFPSASGTVALRDALRRLQATDALRPAEVGHGRSQYLRIAIRGDETRWMDADSGAAATAFICALRSLRVAMNRRLFLGLEEEEAHFACYPAAPPIIAIATSSRTAIRACCRWSAISTRTGCPSMAARCACTCRKRPSTYRPLREPAWFLSGIEHQALPATRERLSVAVWLHARGLGTVYSGGPHTCSSTVRAALRPRTRPLTTITPSARRRWHCSR